jgi:hypothetical protein
VHRDCVHVLEDGDVVDGDGSIVTKLGTRLPISACAHAPGALARPVVDASDAPVPAVAGWIEDAERVNPKGIGYMTASFTVPPAPAANHGQTVFLFPALEPTGGQKIVQPVLQWGASQAGGNYYTSALKRVSAGDTIGGVMAGSSCSGNVCSAWTVVTTDQSTGQSTTLNTTGNAYAMYWVFAGVLEAYGITGCPDYPHNTSTAFTDVYSYNIAGALTAGNWSRPIYHTGCSEAVATGAYNATVSY